MRPATERAFTRAVLNRKIYAAFDGTTGANTLAKLCAELLSAQKAAWLDLREGYVGLKGAKVRDLTCEGFSVRLQHNPGRIRSTLARINEEETKERPCFLCLENLPEDQKGILYRRDYLILCNPMPVFSSHLTIAHLDHQRQAIVDHIDTFLRLMADFGEDWAVLYNGPRCGASAPDHLHFQVVPSGLMPIEKEIREKKRLSRAPQAGTTALYRLRDVGREVVMLEGDDPVALGDAFGGYLASLKKVLIADGEPMINVVGVHQEGHRRLVVFPRRKHRPDAFFKTDETRILVSPAVVEMGGVLVAPLERDFEGLDSALTASIYREVSLDEETVNTSIDTMA